MLLFTTVRFGTIWCPVFMAQFFISIPVQTPARISPQLQRAAKQGCVTHGPILLLITGAF